MTSRRKGGNLLAALWEVVVVVAVGGYIAQIGQYHDSEQTFPRLIAYPIEALALFSLLRRIAAWRRAQAAGASEADEPTDWRALGLGIGLAAAYAALWIPLGFVLDTVLVPVVAARLLGMRWKGVAGSAAISVTIVVLFGYLFAASGMAALPPGIFGINVQW